MSIQRKSWCRARTVAILSLFPVLVLAIPSCQPPSAATGKQPVTIQDKPYLYFAFARRSEIKSGEDLEVTVQWGGTDSSWSLDKFETHRSGNQITITPHIKKVADGSSVAIVTPRNDTCRVSKLPPGDYTVVILGAGGSKQLKVKVK